MSSSPKIVVFKMREIIYTLLLIFLAVLLIVCLVLMFSKKKDESGTAPNAAQNTTQSAAQDTSNDSAADQAESLLETAVYMPGIYTAPITLGDSTVDVEVTVNENEISSIRLVNLSEAAAASFPLVSPSLENITAQILETQSLTGITCPQENRYTSQMLLEAVADALALAKP